MGAPKAPEAEIEITEEMIEAGITALQLWDHGDPLPDVVGSVYRAMETARRNSTEESP